MAGERISNGCFFGSGPPNLLAFTRMIRRFLSFSQRPSHLPDLNLSLDGLHGADGLGGSLQNITPMCPGIALHRDPGGQIDGSWQSPAARLLELQTQVQRPGDWLGLHVALPLYDLRGIRWIGIVARTAADQSLVVRPCLRSGDDDGGFHDQLFPSHLLSQPSETDHHDLIAPDRLLDVPQDAPWRELILFLPPAHNIRWVLHDLRVFVL